MEQKKTKKFNIIDVIALVLLAAIVVFMGYKLATRKTGEGPLVNVTYKVKCEEVPVELYETCMNHLPSPLMASGQLVGGEILSVEKLPFYVPGPNGQWMEDPDHVSLIFTAQTTTPSGDVMTTKVGDQEVRLGKRDYILKSEYIEFQDGTIIDVSWE